MKKICILFACLTVFFILPAKSQTAILNLTRVDTFPVKQGGNTLKLPWAGGLNSVQFSHIDLNGDGIQDLFVFDRDNSKVTTFINTNAPAGDYKTYKYAPKYEAMFPKMQYWCLLRDFNHDGKADIFTSTPGGVKIYKNITPTGQNLQFQLFDTLLKSDYQTGFGLTNIYISSVDIPFIGDLDYDGDLDILTFGVYGTQLEYHENFWYDLHGNYDSLKFKIENECWGHFIENPMDNAINLLDTCPYNVANPQRTTQKVPHNKLHVGSTILALQMNGDSAMDLVLGDVTYPNLVYMENDTDIGTYNMNTSMVAQDTLFPEHFNNTIPVDLDIFPAAFYLDVNNDGKKDLIASPDIQGYNAGDNYRSAWMYKNDGTNAVPNFKIATKGFLQEEMIDVGQGASPCVADINGDGKKDLIIANYIYHDSTGAQLAYYENIGTTAAPAFKMISTNFGHINTYNLDTQLNQPALGLSPTIADINNDGVLDMIVGDAEGHLHWFTINSGGITLVRPNFEGIDVGQFASPQLVDLNGDGLLDLVIGNKAGKIYYYENTGTANGPYFTLVTTHLGNVATNPWWSYQGFCDPYFYKVNGKFRLLCATLPGYLYYYTDIDSNLTGTFTKMDTTYLGIYGGTHITIAGGDFMGNDTIPDIILGQFSGGVTLWQGSVADSNLSVVSFDTKSSRFKIYPNPANNEVFIKYQPNATDYESAYLEVHDLLGKTLMKKRITPNSHFSTKNLSDGIYLFEIKSNNGIVLYRKKMVIAH